MTALAAYEEQPLAEWQEKWAPACPDSSPQRIRRASGFRERNVGELELRVNLGGNDHGPGSSARSTDGESSTPTPTRNSRSTPSIGTASPIPNADDADILNREPWQASSICRQQRERAALQRPKRPKVSLVERQDSASPYLPRENGNREVRQAEVQVRVAAIKLKGSVVVACL